MIVALRGVRLLFSKSLPPLNVPIKHAEWPLLKKLSSSQLPDLVLVVSDLIRSGAIGPADVLAAEQCVSQCPDSVRNKAELNNSFVLQIASKLTHLVLYTGRLFRQIHLSVIGQSQ